MKKLKQLIGAALLVAGLASIGHAATTRYAEIRPTGTLQPNTTGPFAIHVGSATVDEEYTTSTTVRTLLKAKRIQGTGTDISNSQVIYSSGGIFMGDAALTFSASTGLAVSTLTCSSCTLTNAAIGTTAISSGVATDFSATRSTMGALSIGNSFNGNNLRLNNISSGTVAGDAARFSQVKILQVLTYTLSASSANATSSFVPTALAGPITPQSTSSKIFIIADGTLTAANASQGALATIMRNGTSIGGTGGLTGLISAGAIVDGLHVPCHMSILDSPGTTSSITYAVGVKNGGSGTATWNSSSVNALSTLTLIEVNGL